MNKKLLPTVLITASVVAMGLTIPIAKSQAKSDVKFICGKSYDRDNNKRLPTTFAWTSRGKTAIIRWEKNFGKYSPQERCQSVAPRFQEAYDNGTLEIITNAKVNGQPVICAVQEYGDSCQTVLMTLRQKDNSVKMLNDLKDTLNGRSIGPVKNSSGTPQLFYKINMDEFLSNAPVEKE